MGAGLLAGSLVLGGMSTLQQIQGSRADQRISQNISRFNAAVARQNRDLALESAERQAEDVRERTQEVISSHRAALGASNLVTTSGSPMVAQLKQAELGEELAQDVLLEGRIQAAGFSAQATLDDFEAKVGKIRGRNERREMLLSGIGRGLSTAGSLINRER